MADPTAQPNIDLSDGLVPKQPSIDLSDGLVPKNAPAPPAGATGPLAGLPGEGGTKAPVPEPSGLQGAGTDDAMANLKSRLLGRNPIGDTIANVGKHALNDTYGAVKSMVQPPQNEGEAIAGMAMPGGTALYRAAVEPSIQPIKDAGTAISEGRYGDAVAKVGDAVPVLGPMAANFQDEADQKGLVPALAGAGTDALAAVATGKALSAAGKFTKARMPVPGENFTPQQHASFSGVLARGSGAGKGFFPKEVASDIGSATRQAAADNPAINPATAKTPEDSLARTQAVLQKVREGIDQQHAAALRPVANNPVNPRPIQDAVTFPSSLKGFAPQDAAAVQDLKTRLGNVTTLGGLNDLRQYLNTELSSQFKMNSVAAGNTGALTSAMQDALKATRDLYYKELEKASGNNFQGAKRMESSVLKAEEALGNSAPALTAKQAIAEQPRSMRGYAADALQGAHTVSGGPVAGAAKLVANKVLGETPMTPIHEGVQHFFSDLPSPSPKQTAPQIIQPQRGAAPPPAQPRIISPPPRQLSTGTAQGNPGTPPAITAAQQTRLAPPDVTPQLGAGEGNPQFVNPPAAYPPLNQATAQTSVNAGTPKAPQEQIPPRTINVSPQGQAAIQRPELPSPGETAGPAVRYRKGKAYVQDPKTGWWEPRK